MINPDLNLSLVVERLGPSPQEMEIRFPHTKNDKPSGWAHWVLYRESMAKTCDVSELGSTLAFMTTDVKHVPHDAHSRHQGARDPDQAHYHDSIDCLV